MSNIRRESNGILNIDDNISAVDKYELVMKKKKGLKFYTELEAYNELGEKLWDDSNELILSGGLLTLSKIANLKLPLNITTMNSDLGVYATESNPIAPTVIRDNDAIYGFAIGIGGCTDVLDTVSTVEYKERTVSSIIPFRRVEGALLDASVRNQYAMMKNSGGFCEYYVKKFETTPRIYIEYDKPGSPAVEANADTVLGNDVINTYVQFTIKISKDDIRNYFEQIGGGLRKARVNSLSLVSGYPQQVTFNGTTYTEYLGTRCFSKINFNNEPFDNDTKELTIVYKIYI